MYNVRVGGVHTLVNLSNKVERVRKRYSKKDALATRIAKRVIKEARKKAPEDTGFLKDKGPSYTHRGNKLTIRFKAFRTRAGRSTHGGKFDYAWWTHNAMKASQVRRTGGPKYLDRGYSASLTYTKKELDRFYKRPWKK